MSDLPTSAATTVAHPDHDRDYSDLLAAVERTFDRATADGSTLFTTSAEGIFDLYLDGLPADRQFHNCHACRRFMEVFGGLVTIGEAGQTRSAMWSADEAPEFYRGAFQAMAKRVESARVTGPFLRKEAVWGTPVTGEWTHVSVRPPSALVFKERALTPGQAMAAKREDFKTVKVALGEFKPTLLDEALRILKTDAGLRNAERYITPLQWLRNLHDRPRGPAGDNVLWREIATAPNGYLHPRAAATGSLLEDLAAGLGYDDVKRRWNAKMHPLQFQRPQAPPTEGAIKQAEALFEKLQLAPALQRRFARIEEVPLIWSPSAPPKPEGRGGVFGHLTPKGEAAQSPLRLPTQVMTWEKFARTVLPEAREIEFLVPRSGNFIGLTTQAVADAPPILKWDFEASRNPLAWYLYNGGSVASRWGLRPHGMVRVTGITKYPTEHANMPYLHRGIILLLQGCVDSDTASSCLFPECLKDELHGVRAVIEAHSRQDKLSGRAEASACGYGLTPTSAACSLRVTTAPGATTLYNIDRLD